MPGNGNSNRRWSEPRGKKRDYGLCFESTHVHSLRFESRRRLPTIEQVCVQPRQLGCQHGTARNGCCAPCCGAVAAGCPALSIDISMPARRSAANPSHSAAGVG